VKTNREILIVDDNPADIDLACEALSQGSPPTHVSSVEDGVEAVAFLNRDGKYASARRPDLIVLDLNLPRKDGRTVLVEVKSDPNLRRTPIVVFSTSRAPHDIAGSFELGANSYVSKPGDLEGFLAAITSIERFWFHCARLPHEEEL